MTFRLPRLADVCLPLMAWACWGLIGCQPAPSPEDTSPAAGTGITGAGANQAADDENARLDRLAYPSLRVTTLEGDDYDLHDHRGHWVLVNFWATWCAPCLKEMPELSALHAMREHIKVIGLLVFDDLAPNDLRGFLDEHPVSYPIAVVDDDELLADFAPLRGLPTTYLITPEGQVARQLLAPVTAAQLEEIIVHYAGN